MEVFSIQDEAYSGPLDLLLLLAEQQEIDLCLVSLAKVTDQFRNYILVIEKLEMDEAVGYLVLAARLVEIKSESILPKPSLDLEPIPEAPPDHVDSREDLLRQLEEYRKYRDAALTMMGLAGRQELFRPRRPVDLSSLPPNFQQVELWDLVSAYARLLRETNPTKTEKIKEDYLPLEVLMRQTRESVVARGKIQLEDLVRQDATRARLIGLFLAVLELIKLGGLVAVQEGDFGPILLVDPDSMQKLAVA